MSNISIYVGTYNKYNNGSIEGKWLQLSDFSDYKELRQAMYELHSDEEDPEFMFQDYECPELFEELGLISESHISPDIYEVIETIENHFYDIEVIEAYANCIGGADSIEELLERIEESYSGSYDSNIDFVQELLEDCGDIPKDLPHYIHIDWDSTARDIMMDYSTSNGHYFRNV